MTTPDPSHRPHRPSSTSQGRHLRSVRPADAPTRPSDPDGPTRVRLRDEVDLLALVPYTFGFHPQESLVMMLLGEDGRPMFARVDMPSDAHTAELACAELLRAATVNEGHRALLVAYTHHPAAAYLAAEQAADELARAGVDVVSAVRADGHHWWRLLPLPDLEGAAYDLGSHPITATGVLEGRVTHGSRRRLEESLLPADPDVPEEVASAHASLPPLSHDLLARREEARWLQAWVAGRAVAQQDTDTDTDAGAGGVDPRRLEADELARVLRALADVELRDVAWASMTRADADRHVRLWTEVVVRCPLDLLAPAAGLLAFAAWLSGHGALAWCAVDRALHSDPDHRLAHLVAQTLEQALPPTTWEGLDAESLTILSG